MTIPNFQHFYAHVLKALEDNQVKNRQEIYKLVYESMEFSEEELSERTKSSQQVVVNRANSAITYLNKAKAVERVK